MGKTDHRGSLSKFLHGGCPSGRLLAYTAAVDAGRPARVHDGSSTSAIRISDQGAANPPRPRGRALVWKVVPSFSISSFAMKPGQADEGRTNSLRGPLLGPRNISDRRQLSGRGIVSRFFHLAFLTDARSLARSRLALNLLLRSAFGASSRRNI